MSEFEIDVLYALGFGFGSIFWAIVYDIISRRG